MRRIVAGLLTLTTMTTFAAGNAAYCSSPTINNRDFFTNAFGFSETTYAETQQRLQDAASFEHGPSRFGAFQTERCVIRGAAGAMLDAGVFFFPTVAELHAEVESALKDPEIAATLEALQKEFGTQPSLRTLPGESRSLHLSEETRGEGAVVQAASQFNLLEFPGPRVTPEAGITGYIYDKTQGPACAIACAAGTAYRNYLVSRQVFGSGGEAAPRGQTADWQLNGIAEIEALFASRLERPPWRVKNGYSESAPPRLRAFNELLAVDENLRERAVQLLRIGVQQDTAVTDGRRDSQRRVTQVYASAMAIGYSLCPPALWEQAARLVLDGAYEATLLVGVLETLRHAAQKNEGAATGDRQLRRPPVLLTRVGGGVFLNDVSWIDESIERARVIVKKRYGVPLDVAVVVYDGSSSTPSASTWYD